ACRRSPRTRRSRRGRRWPTRSPRRSRRPAPWRWLIRFERTPAGSSPWSRTPASASPRSAGLRNPAHEAEDQFGYLVVRVFQQEVPAVEQVDLRVGHVVGEGARTGRPEDLIVLAPYREHRRAVAPQVLVQGRVQRRVGCVVAEQRELDRVVARPRKQREVALPGVRADQGLVGDAGDVLPAGHVEGQRRPDGRFGLWCLLPLVVPHGLPEAGHEARVVAVAVLGDDRRDRARVREREPPADRGAVVVDVDGVARDPELGQEPGGQPAQGVERVREGVGRRGVGEPEPEQVGGDHAVALRQRRYQVAEHERARRETMQEHDDRGVRRPRLAVEQALALHRRIAVVNGCHANSSLCYGGYAQLSLMDRTSLTHYPLTRQGKSPSKNSWGL